MVEKVQSLDWLSFVLRLWDFQTWVYVPSLLSGGGNLELGLFFDMDTGSGVLVVMFYIFLLWFRALWASASLVSCCWCPCRPILGHESGGGSHSPFGFFRPPDWRESPRTMAWKFRLVKYTSRLTRSPCWHKEWNEYPQLTWQKVDGGVFVASFLTVLGKMTWLTWACRFGA